MSPYHWLNAVALAMTVLALLRRLVEETRDWRRDHAEQQADALRAGRDQMREDMDQALTRSRRAALVDHETFVRAVYERQPLIVSAAGVARYTFHRGPISDEIIRKFCPCSTCRTMPPAPVVLHPRVTLPSHSHSGELVRQVIERDMTGTPILVYRTFCEQYDDPRLMDTTL